MERRIFLATKKENTVGVNFNVTDNKANKFTIVYDNAGKEMQGFSDTRLSALSALVEVIEKTDIEELNNVVPVFVNQSLAEFLQNETYKFWILTGAKSTGETIQETEMNMLKKFVDVWKEKGDYFVIRDIFTCRIHDKVKADPAKLAKFKLYSRQNDAYCRYAWQEIAKLYNETIDNAITSVQ